MATMLPAFVHLSVLTSEDKLPLVSEKAVEAENVELDSVHDFDLHTADDPPVKSNEDVSSSGDRTRVDAGRRQTQFEQYTLDADTVRSKLAHLLDAEPPSTDSTDEDQRSAGTPLSKEAVREATASIDNVYDHSKESQPTPRDKRITPIKRYGPAERSKRLRGLAANAAHTALEPEEINTLAALAAVPAVYAATVHSAYAVLFLACIASLVARTPLLSRSTGSGSPLGVFLVAASLLASLFLSIFPSRVLLLLSVFSLLVAVVRIQSRDFFAFGRQKRGVPCLSRWEVDMLAEDAGCRFREARALFCDLVDWQESLDRRFRRVEKVDGGAARCCASSCGVAAKAKAVLRKAELLDGQSAACSEENDRRYWIFGPRRMFDFLGRLDAANDELAYECNTWLSELKAQA